MNYHEVSVEAITLVGECVHYETASEARRSIQSYWQDFKARGKAEALESYRNQQIDGFVGVLIPKPNDRLDYMIAVSSDQDPVEFETRKLPAGRYLIFEAEGPLPFKLREVMDAIHHDFLPKSSYNLREAPIMEHYPSGDTQSADYLSEIWIPVE
ncbi:GyrI-like domain-containing protein [Macrococcus brunensis]|uniref:GyrI-like domain-containing protein n=1 Tax=Macrococcus brunensis TaxID=198483 RepID=UPI00140B48DE|nr:GyrI-like domain-containing protein [Macrococcus brunensis]ULG74595.1 GyrI-like domain-containing protein [Macrococcus brunensis]